MKVLIARDLVKYHGGDLKVLSGASLAVEAGEKIGLVGRNGAGKTTLLNILSGNLEPDGRLQAEFDRDGGYEYRARAASALSSLGFDPADWKRPVSSFSGGEQNRIALARLLLSEPDLVLLDEPTNHLDLGAIEWLGNFVKNAKSAVIVVS